MDSSEGGGVDIQTLHKSFKEDLEEIITVTKKKYIESYDSNLGYLLRDFLRLKLDYIRGVEALANENRIKLVAEALASQGLISQEELKKIE